MNLSYSVDFKHRPRNRVPGGADLESAIAGLFKLDELERHRMHGDELLLINHRTRRRALVNVSLQGVLDLFGEFRTRSGHRQAVAEALSELAVAPEAIGDVLEDLFTAGMMVSAEEWLARFPPSPGETLAPSAWSLVITTCDRPLLLQRLMSSLLPHLAGVARPVRVLLIDDSRAVALRAHNAEIFGHWLAASGFQGQRWDREARGGFADALAEAFPEHRRTLRWLLAPGAFPDDVVTVGQGRNLALLLSAGSRMLMLDDDCVAQPFRHEAGRHDAEAQDGLRVCFHGSALHPYPDLAALWADAASAELNPLQAHLEVLGQPLRAVFDRLGQRWRDPDWLGAVDQGTHGRLVPETRIGITGNATLGDPGFGDMTAFYAESANLEQRVAFLAATPEDQPLTRHFWHGGGHSWISFGRPLMTTTLTGIDNRRLMPCVAPTGRGSDDRVLGLVLSALAPEVARLEFNWALPHLPDQPRSWNRPGPSGRVADPDPVQALIATIQHAASRVQGSGEDLRLQELANQLLVLNRISDGELGGYADARVVDGILPLLQAYQKNLRHTQMRGPMHQDLSHLLRHAQVRLGQPFSPSREWLQYFRASCEVYADALMLWPRLRQWVQRSSAAASE
jgi:hypothetical protein